MRISDTLSIRRRGDRWMVARSQLPGGHPGSYAKEGLSMFVD
jgi:hypothetical protein